MWIRLKNSQCLYIINKRQNKTRQKRYGCYKFIFIILNSAWGVKLVLKKPVALIKERQDSLDAAASASKLYVTPWHFDQSFNMYSEWSVCECVCVCVLIYVGMGVSVSLSLCTCVCVWRRTKLLISCMLTKFLRLNFQEHGHNFSHFTTHFWARPMKITWLKSNLLYRTNSKKLFVYNSVHSQSIWLPTLIIRQIHLARPAWSFDIPNLPQFHNYNRPWVVAGN